MGSAGSSSLVLLQHPSPCSENFLQRARCLLRAGLSEGVNTGLERMHAGFRQIATFVLTAVERHAASSEQFELGLVEAERNVGVAILGTLGSGALKLSIVMRQRCCADAIGDRCGGSGCTSR